MDAAPPIDPWWLVHLKLAGASLCGGIVRLIFRPTDSIIKAVWLLFGCVTCGYFGTPVAVRYWEAGPDLVGAVGALVGFVGLTVAGAVLRATEALDLRALIARIAGVQP